MVRLDNKIFLTENLAMKSFKKGSSSLAIYVHSFHNATYQTKIKVRKNTLVYFITFSKIYFSSNWEPKKYNIFRLKHVTLNYSVFKNRKNKAHYT